MLAGPVLMPISIPICPVFAKSSQPCSYSVPILYYCSIVFYSLCTWLFGGATCIHATVLIVLCLLLLFCIGLFTVICCLSSNINRWIFVMLFNISASRSALVLCCFVDWYCMYVSAITAVGLMWCLLHVICLPLVVSCIV